MVRSVLQFKLPARSLLNYLIFSGLLFFGIPATDCVAQGNLLISPRRLVFDGTKRTQEINLANTGKDTAKYLISVMEIRMTEDGGFEEIATPDSGQFFASKFLRFFPRSVTLAPNESQVVKVQLVKTNEATEGEYRSHVYFRALPNSKPLGEKEAAKDTTAISVSLTPVFGITIPIIVRNGESTTKVTISDVSLGMSPESVPVVGMTFNRTGNMSSYGDIIVEYIGDDGKATEVGTAKGVAVYTPNKLRKFRFELNKDAKINVHKGKLRVSYVPQTDEKAGKGDHKQASFADTEIALH